MTAIHLEQMLTLARSGVRIVPPVPPFYQRAATVGELADQIVARVLDQIGIHIDVPNRWRGHTMTRRATIRFRSPLFHAIQVYGSKRTGRDGRKRDEREIRSATSAFGDNRT
ncbi:MAG: hypothetical protein M5R38_02000 [Candidatus Methylomirabilis sp.]|nr:hypothetical protein [Candidatus Methylomirabilis sp.]